jgi:hypothetical protein
MTTREERKLKLILKRKAQPLLRPTKGVKYPKVKQLRASMRRSR